MMWKGSSKKVFTAQRQSKASLTFGKVSQLSMKEKFSGSGQERDEENSPAQGSSTEPCRTPQLTGVPGRYLSDIIQIILKERS